MITEIKTQAEQQMKKAIEATAKDFNGVRTGRASLALLDGIMVEYYGTPTPLNQVATLAIPESRLIIIQPWDSSLLQSIEKAILKSDLGITPTNDGRVVRIAIPPLTEERRKELVRVIRKMAEEGRIAVRNIRRDANDHLKKAEKEKKISEDEAKKAMEEIQNLTDRFIKEIDDLLAKKEREIMEF
ncbi:MAG: ribosome recycling factor [candidate division NC10 bacterium]|nr:ribosome recycling factor [candidate division NC10 bacterium]